MAKTEADDIEDQIYWLCDKFRDGGMSWALAAEKITEKGYTTKSGVPFTGANLKAWKERRDENGYGDSTDKPEEKLMSTPEEPKVAHAPQPAPEMRVDPCGSIISDRDVVRTEVLNEVAAKFLTDATYPLPMRNKIAMSVLAVGA